MQNQHTKSKIISSLFWKLMERSGTQGIQFIVQIVLARLLLPEEYGIIAIVNVFILLANVFVQSGFNMALIQKKDADELDFSSVFYLSLFIAGLLYVVIFLNAPFIADYYRNPQLVSVLRVLAVILFFGAVNSIQNAYIAKEMMFKKLFVSSLGAIIVSGSIGVYTAYIGLGVWALVAQQISNQLMVTMILWFTVKWRPKLIFSISRVKYLFSFGWKLLVSSLINTVYMNLRTLIIGRGYSSEQLGFYNRGMQFPQIIVNNINGSIQSVMLPALASNQDNVKRVKDMMKRAIITSSFIIFPMMVGLAVIAEPLVNVVLTEKWLPAVPFLQIYCAVYGLKPIYTANLQAINALGRSDIFLRLEAITTIIGIVILIISSPFGVLAISWGALISGVVSLVVYMRPNSRLIDYGAKEQIKDVLPSLILSSFMGAIIYLFNFLEINKLFVLLIQLFVGISIYLFLSKLFKLESYTYLVRTIKEMRTNK